MSAEKAIQQETPAEDPKTGDSTLEDSAKVDEKLDEKPDDELGGPSNTPCFGLLDGFFTDPETGERSRVTIPITALPATLGRSNETDSEDPHFFGLGKKKALSRKQCRISYRDVQGGIVERDKKSNELLYKDPSGEGSKALPPLIDETDLPSRGFFVVECLGKNRILVNQGRVEQGNAAVLESRAALRISSYTLYFVKPTDVSSTKHEVVSRPDVEKKRKIPDAASSSAIGPKKVKANQEDLESLPVGILLTRMTEAIENDQWERKHQLIGATIALHAVRDSARDPKIQAVAVEGGVSRSEIMAWIEEADKYAGWVQQMLAKMEARSYQAAITKCLLKAGFTRTGSSGRYIKWHLPKDIAKRE